MFEDGSYEEDVFGTPLPYACSAAADPSPAAEPSFGELSPAVQRLLARRLAGLPTLDAAVRDGRWLNQHGWTDGPAG